MTKILKAIALAGPLTALAALVLSPVLAQGWGWDGRDRRSPPPPVYNQQRPDGYDNYARTPAYGSRGPASQDTRNPRCRQLEDQLAGGWTHNGSDAQDQLPKLDADIEKASRDYRRAQADTERADCYDDMFIFGRSLRQNRKCIDMDNQVQSLRGQVTQLRAQRDSLARSTDVHAVQNDLLAELARNNCGDAYTREYRSRNHTPSFFDFWSDEDSDDQRGSSGFPLDAANTYRTICVRLCDGFYFPISYSTLPSRFPEDEAKCKSQCAAPSELFYHRIPDQDVEQAVSIDGRPYTALPNAFRNRKVYIRGCSCKPAEYSRDEIVKSEEALRNKSAANMSHPVAALPGAAISGSALAPKAGEASSSETPPTAAIANPSAAVSGTEAPDKTASAPQPAKKMQQ